MSAGTVQALCQRVRPELACLGEPGMALLATVGVVEATGGRRALAVLTDPAFALEVLMASGADGDAALVGRVLEFLRTRAGAPASGGAGAMLAPSPSLPPTRRRAGRLADAVATYESGALALMARGTQHTYRTWTRRLVALHGDDEPDAITAGDLKDLIARHVLTGRDERDRRRSGRSAEENAVTAYRHLWAYFEEKGWASENVAMRLRKPSRSEPRRRAIQPDEAALLRQLACATGQDPLLDEVTLTIPERLGLRRIELCRLRLCDLKLGRRVMDVWGKNDKQRTMPLPPALTELLERYVEDRRPAHLSPADWRRSEESLLRRPPAGTSRLGRPAGRRRIEDLFERLRAAAPDLFAGGELSLHSYRHGLGTFVDARFGRAATRAVLGHSSRRTPTDFYVHVPIETMIEAITAYEEHLLTAAMGAAAA